ncbi:MAG: RNA polymerase sigma factor SigZ [Bacteroidota bacterium]
MEIAGIYQQFHSTLLSYIQSKVKTKEDAEDIVQNVFIKISVNISKLGEKEKLQSWIYAITRNAIIDYYRANANKRSVAIDENLEESLAEEKRADDTKGLEQCLSGMITLLPEEYRNIIVDSEIKGIKQKDLAEKYAMAYPSMRSRVQRGREKLKQLLHNCCHIETDTLGNILDAHNRKDCNGPCNSCATE